MKYIKKYNKQIKKELKELYKMHLHLVEQIQELRKLNESWHTISIILKDNPGYISYKYKRNKIFIKGNN